MHIKQYLEISGWGPIRYKLSEPIEIKPLTIFIGANNTGKSYVAITYYSLSKILINLIKFLSRDDVVKDVSADLHLYARLKDILSKDVVVKEVIEKLADINDIKELENKLIKELKTRLLSIMESIEEHKLILIIIGKELSEDDVRKVVEESFGSSLDELKNFDSKSFNIVLNTVFYDEIVISIGLRKPSRGKSRGLIDIVFKDKFKKRIRGLYRRILDKRVDKYVQAYIKTSVIWEHLERSKRIELLYSIMLSIYLDLIVYILEKIRDRVRDSIKGIYYLPASRSGLLINYKGLLSTLLALATKPTVLKEVYIPGFSGYITDFINTLLLSESKKTLKDTASMIEEYILNGRIVVEKTDTFPEIYYLDMYGNKVPLKRISSLVSELAPLAIYMKKGFMDKGSIVIIEEPESHLHPQAQVILTCLLTKLVIEQGVRIIITTHSDILLSKLSNIISKYYAETPVIEREHLLCKNTYLSKEFVSAYLFNRDSKWTQVKKIKITEHGIPDDEFRVVYEKLYEEYMTLYYKLGEKT